MNSPDMNQTNTPLLAPSSPPTRRLASFIGLIVLGGLAVILATGSYRFMTVPATKALAQIPGASNVPFFVHEGDRIVVPEGSALRTKLTIEAVAEQEIRRTLVLPAVVEADPSHLVKIVPPLTGRITQLKVQLGERVTANQPLAILDSPDLASAYAEHERANVLLELARKNRDRTRDLEKIGGAATKEFLQAEADYVTADVEHQRADARLRKIGVYPEASDPARTLTITTPITGSVIELATAAGAFWNDTNAALMTVADLSTIWVTANVPEKDTALISKGQPVDVEFSAYAGEVFKGEVLFVSDVLDPDMRRTKVRIAFANSNMRLKPNMFANVTFFAPPRMAAAVPTSALVLKNDSDRVFVEVAPWTFVMRPVEVSYQQGNVAIMKSGLAVGERAVVKGGVLLND
jgi:cobalt-zinc-cadmium efflux system membrane fusion protein